MGSERKIVAVSRPTLALIQMVMAAVGILRFPPASFAICTFKSI